MQVHSIVNIDVLFEKRQLFCLKSHFIFAILLFLSSANMRVLHIYDFYEQEVSRIVLAVIDFNLIQSRIDEIYNS